ncbi:MAG: hypothetical protein V1886_01750 [archaeon]
MPKKEKQEVARTTILVLLVLTILLSVISTWYVLDMITSVKQQYSSDTPVSYAQIKVGIGNPAEETLEGIPAG